MIKFNRSWFFIVILAAFFPISAEAQFMWMDKPIVQIITELIQYLLTLAGGVAIFMIIISGIYYMASGGNTQGKATAKKMLTSALGGLMLVLISYIVLIIIDQLVVQP